VAIVRSGLAFALAVAGGCTFTGLGDYDVTACTPGAKSQETDVCDRLTPTDPCLPYQCDNATQRCVERLRDDDRDGDPPTACGGTDCNDHLATQSGIASEVCDGLANTCDGLVDEGLYTKTTARVIQQVPGLDLAADVSMTEASRGAEATFVARANTKNLMGRCLESVGPDGYLDNGCSFLASELSLSPRQPAVAEVGGGRGAVTVATTDPCPMGALLYRFVAPSLAGEASVACDPTSGVALPALAPLSMTEAVIAWYAVPFSERDNPAQDCAGAKPGPLMIAVVQDAVGGSGTISSSMVLSKTSTSIRRPALRRLPGKDEVILVAPLDSSVGIWTLSSAVEPPSPVVISGLANARGVGVGLTPDGAQMAVVADIGCSAQAIKLALGSVGKGFPTVVEVAAPNGALAVDPEVAWVPSRQEWFVTWISVAGGAHVMARRFTRDGVPVGGPIDASVQATVAMPTGMGDIFTFDGTSLFNSTGIGCNQ
jgi:hypothetical protein